MGVLLLLLWAQHRTTEPICPFANPHFITFNPLPIATRLQLCVAQAGLELVIFLPQTSRMTGMYHYAQLKVGNVRPSYLSAANTVSQKSAYSL